MTFMLRDRPDGQVEIIIQRPVLVGVFPEREVAERVVAFLNIDEPDLPEDRPADFVTAAADVAEADAEDVEETVRALVAEQGDATERVWIPQPGPGSVSGAQLLVPVGGAQSRAPALLKVTAPHGLSAAQVAAAFARIGAGEKLSEVARDIGVPMGQLRGLWAHSKRQLQRHMAEGGQEPCRLCQKPFTPSVSHPDTCARCSQ